MNNTKSKEETQLDEESVHQLENFKEELTRLNKFLQEAESLQQKMERLFRDFREDIILPIPNELKKIQDRRNDLKSKIGQLKKDLKPLHPYFEHVNSWEVARKRNKIFTELTKLPEFRNQHVLVFAANCCVRLHYNMNGYIDLLEIMKKSDGSRLLSPIIQYIRFGVTVDFVEIFDDREIVIPDEWRQEE